MFSPHVAFEINQGRVMVLFLIGYEMCSAFVRRHALHLFWRFANQLLNCLLKFLAQAGFFTWLEQQGGWVRNATMLVQLRINYNDSLSLSLFLPLLIPLPLPPPSLPPSCAYTARSALLHPEKHTRSHHTIWPGGIGDCWIGLAETAFLLSWIKNSLTFCWLSLIASIK